MRTGYIAGQERVRKIEVPDTSLCMRGDTMTKSPLDKENEGEPSETESGIDNQLSTSGKPGMNGEEQQQEGKNTVHLKLLSAGEEAQVGSTEGRGLSDVSIVIENPTATRETPRSQE